MAGGILQTLASFRTRKGLPVRARLAIATGNAVSGVQVNMLKCPLYSDLYIYIYINGYNYQYVCMYVCMYICIYIYIHTFIHTYVYMYMYTCTYIQPKFLGADWLYVCKGNMHIAKILAR